MTPTITPPYRPESSKPWWQYGHVWLVVAGPLVVVVASICTYFIAVYSADGLVSKDPVVQVVPQAGVVGHVNPAMLPSLVGRNHAASPKTVGAP